MPESDTTSPSPDDPRPTTLSGLDPSELLARGLHTAKMSSAGAHGWEPPSVVEVAVLFPSYEVLAMLGRGGMGAVYKARQTSLDRVVAIKLLPLEVSVDQAFADRFRREARAMAKLNHPHIITVFDFGQTAEGHLFFVMEFVEGANLADIIHQVGLAPDQALSLAGKVCAALAYAHGKGVIHRDIKPANVMVDAENQVKVADFGLARLTDPTAETYGTTMTGTIMGTPDYMAPEQMRGMNVDHRADIYSLGVMLYEMLCRETPRGAFDLPSQRTGCDPRLDAIVLKAMQQAPERRYQSTQEMKADVETARTPLPEAPLPTAAPRSLPKPLPRAPKIAAVPKATNKRRAPLWIASIAALLVLGGLTVLYRTTLGKRNAAPAVLVDDAALWKNAVDLLPLIDPAKNAVAGNWKRTPDGIETDVTFCSRLAIPYQPPEEYDFRITFTRLEAKGAGRSGWGDATQILSKDGRSFVWTMGAHGNTWFGFSLVDGKRFDKNVTGVETAQCLQTQQRYTATVCVRKDSAQAFLDGKLISTWRSELGALTGEAFWAIPDPKSLGISATNVQTVFHSIEVREVTGKGHVTTEAATASSAATKDAPFVNSLGMKFVPVPITGGPTGGQRVLFSVWETRVQDYALFAEETKRAWRKQNFEQGPTHPAVHIAREDATAFCRWLTERERQAGRIGAGEAYRLPSDHEWSCAAGLGGREDASHSVEEKMHRIKDAFPWGTAWPPPATAGNYAGDEAREAMVFSNITFIPGHRDAFPATAPVGSFLPNSAGLLDLGGNVWEWATAAPGVMSGPWFTRGACFADGHRQNLLSSSRHLRAEGFHDASIGFRVVLAPTAPGEK